MRWLAKAAVQKAIGILPGASHIYYLVQRRVVQTLPINDKQWWEQAHIAFLHLSALRKHVGARLPDYSLFEFGAGYDLTIPLILAAAGVGKQMVVDRVPNMRLGLVQNNLERMARLSPVLRSEFEFEYTPRFLASASRKVSLGTLREMGIDYEVRDIRRTGFPDGAFDFISNTSTLEHIPSADLSLLLSECRRVLRTGGCISSLVNLADNFAQADSSITQYNYLRYSNRCWALLNPSIFYQNRLRAPDYIRLLRDSGFAIVSVTAESGLPSEALERLPVHPEFGAYSNEELSVTSLHVVGSVPPS